MRGLLYCGTFNLHRMARSPFWKDHDICVVENRMTGQRTYVDPSLFDEKLAEDAKNSISVGVNNVTYETDYPHTDTTWPHTMEYVEKVMAGIPDEIVYKILRGNALRMLSLDDDLKLTN